MSRSRPVGILSLAMAAIALVCSGFSARMSPDPYMPAVGVLEGDDENGFFVRCYVDCDPGWFTEDIVELGLCGATQFCCGWVNCENRETDRSKTCCESQPDCVPGHNTNPPSQSSCLSDP